MSKGNTTRAMNLMREFCKLHGIKLNKIIIDMRKTRNEYKTQGLFGGFFDMYDEETKTMYFNPYNFVEFVNPKSPYNIAHLACHELIHTKQIQTGDMFLQHTGLMMYKNKVYQRAPFKIDLFNKIRQVSGKLAEEYHMSTLPWERDAYKKAEEFMGRPLWRAYA